MIERDQNTGEPNGVLHEGAQDLVVDVAPSWSHDEQLTIYKEAMRYCNSLGITSTVPGNVTSDTFKIYQAIYAAGEMTVRIRPNFVPFQQKLPPSKELEELLNRMDVLSDSRNEWLSFSSLKWFADGGFRIAWTRELHPDPKIGYGDSLIPTEYLNEVVAIANRYGWRVAIHCVGDAAIDQVLNAYERANNEKSIKNRRWVVIHASLMQPDQMERAKKLGVIVTLQDFMWIRAASAERDLGEEMAHRVGPARSIIDTMGIKSISLGTDYSVNPMNPFICMYVFITRKDPRGVVYGPDQAITREEALRLYTSSAAYYTFSEDLKGTIESGRLADLAVLSDDILTCPEETIKDIKVLMTIVDGRIVYETN